MKMNNRKGMENRMRPSPKISLKIGQVLSMRENAISSNVNTRTEVGKYDRLAGLTARALKV